VRRYTTSTYLVVLWEITNTYLSIQGECTNTYLSCATRDYQYVPEQWCQWSCLQAAMCWLHLHRLRTWRSESDSAGRRSTLPPDKMSATLADCVSGRSARRPGRAAAVCMPDCRWCTAREWTACRMRTGVVEGYCVSVTHTHTVPVTCGLKRLHTHTPYRWPVDWNVYTP